MDVFECVSTLSSVRNYVDKNVSDEVIMNILEAGRLAPSAHNDQPWEFILLKGREKINRISQYCLSGRFVSDSDFAVVVLTDKRSKWYEIDGTRAVQNMAITAWSFGIGTCWIGRIDREGLASYLNTPDRWHVLTVLPFGYYDQRILRARKIRKSKNEVFHFNEYGKKSDMFSP